MTSQAVRNALAAIGVLYVAASAVAAAAVTHNVESVSTPAGVTVIDLAGLEPEVISRIKTPWGLPPSPSPSAAWVGREALILPDPIR